MSDKSMSGPLVPIFAAQASLSPPASKTDTSAGIALAGTAALKPNHTGPVRHAFVVEHDTGATITNVEILVMVEGIWRYLAQPDVGTALFSSLTLPALFPVQFVVEDLGSPERIALVCTIPSGTLSAWIMRVDRE